MSAPIIGLTTRNDSDPKHGYPTITSPRTYLEALVQAGSIPVLIPVNLDIESLPNLLSRLDGIILTGGGDISLDHFEGEAHQRIYDVDPERDHIELALAQLVVERELPFLGICRGFQVLNVALGGTLYTHIEDQLPGAVQHENFSAYPPNHRAHSIQLKSGSRLAEIYQQEEVLVNSLHHQGIKDSASPWEIIGHAPDGLVEAFQLPGHPFGLGVQWHPEWMPDDQYQRQLFAAFTQAARDHHRKRASA